MRYADELLNKKLRVKESIPDTPEFDIDNLDWNIQIGNIPNTYQLYLQSLEPIRFLILAYDETRDVKYMDLAWKFLESWARYQKDQELTKNNKYVWDSHGMAMRTENLILLASIGKKNNYFKEEQWECIHNLLLLHGSKLSNEKYYHPCHNHGTAQDKALINLAYYFNEQSREYIELAKKRLEIQWNYEFTDEMVSTENSFGYHVFNLKLYYDIMNYLYDKGDVWGTEKLEKLNLAENVIGWMLKPNGYSPNFGESYILDYNKNSEGGKKGEVLRYAISKGKEGVEPQSNSIIFPKAGYYVGREYWNGEKYGKSYEQSTWTLFKAGFSSVVHKQDDDTSFEFYSKGYDIFVDSGFNGYVSNDLRTYLTSANAHNMVSVDEKTYHGKKQDASNVQNAGISYYNIKESDKWNYILGYNNMFKNVKLERHFINFKEAIFILDESVAEKEHNYTQNFQCGPDIKIVSYNDNEVLLCIAESGFFVKIKQLNKNTTCKILHGKEKTNYGQYSPKMGKVEYLDTIKFTNISINLELATLITIEDESGKCIDFSDFIYDRVKKGIIFTDFNNNSEMIVLK